MCMVLVYLLVTIVGPCLSPSLGCVPGPQRVDCGSVLSSTVGCVPWLTPSVRWNLVGSVSCFTVFWGCGLCGFCVTSLRGMWTLVYPKRGLGVGGFCFLLPFSVCGGSWLLWVVGSVLPLRVECGPWLGFEFCLFLLPA
jgi:hypothetical protein